MNSVDCFHPSLQPIFTDRPDISQWPIRQLFYRLMQGGDQAMPLAYHWLQQQFNDAEKSCRHEFIAYQPQAVTHLRLADACPVWTLPLEELLLQAAPVLLTEVSGLAAASNAATNCHPIAARLFAVYLQITEGMDYRELVQGILSANGYTCPSLTSWAFVAQADRADSLFTMAAIQKALTYCPRIFLPELLGFTQALFLTEGIVGFTVQNVIANHPVVLRQNRLAAQYSPLVGIVDDYCRHYPQHTDILWRRLQTGFLLYQQLLDCCRQDLQQKLGQALVLGDVVGKLLANKAVAASGHHRTLLLGGRKIDEWFAQSPFDSLGFMQALLNSPYVDLNNPQQSLLLKLFSFNGPMFGVLSAQEIQVLENWLVAGGQIVSADSFSPTVKSIVDCQPDSIRKTGTPKISSSISNRKFFYYLVNADIFPAVSAVAKNKINSVLRFAGVGRPLPFKHYSHWRFQEHFDKLYQKEIKSYQPLSGRPKLTKEAYLWGIEQFAPTILIDGCWLQNCRQLDSAGYPLIANLLGKIYQDELGGGKPTQNHPLIYRQLLVSQSITIPPVYCPSFIDHPEFLDSAFDLPVYLLAISLFPHEFLPELLGLNMAIEISGLGKVYLRLADELSYWGINPAIINLHTTIDNMASGHAALAQNAIALYLDAIAASAGEAQMHRHWSRVYTGYCSLQAAARWFKAALVGRHLFNQRTNYIPYFLSKPTR